MLAPTPSNLLFLFDLNFPRFDASPFMRAVAERLGFRSPTATPVIGTGLHLLNIRKPLRDNRIRHFHPPIIKFHGMLWFIGSIVNIEVSRSGLRQCFR